MSHDRVGMDIRRPRRGLGGWVVVLLSLLPLVVQGQIHDHTSVLDVVQCAVCHAGQAQLSRSGATVADAALEHVVEETVFLGLVRSEPAPRHLPPVRGPPTSS